MRTTPFFKKTESFIETGCYIGQGIDLAIHSGFTDIYSIELTPHYYQLCKDKFKDNPNVNLILGDSYYELDNLLKENPNKQFTYWLDGHYSGDDTGFGVKETPLIKELETILSRGITGEIIYIDDMRIYREFDDEVNSRTIYDILKKYVPHGQIHYEASPHDSQDILVVDY